MSKEIGNTFEDLLAELNKRPGFRKEYRKLGPYYDLIREIFDKRKSLGWTQERLAKEAGTHQANVSRIESGDLDARLSTIIELAEAMNTRLDLRLVEHFDDVDDEEYKPLFKVSGKSGSTEQYVVQTTSRSKVKVL